MPYVIYFCALLERLMRAGVVRGYKYAFFQGYLVKWEPHGIRAGGIFLELETLLPPPDDAATRMALEKLVATGAPEQPAGELEQELRVALLGSGCLEQIEGEQPRAEIEWTECGEELLAFLVACRKARIEPGDIGDLLRLPRYD